MNDGSEEALGQEVMMSMHEYGKWIALVCLTVAPGAFGADVLIDNFNGSYIFDGDWIEEDWTPRAWWNGTWHREGVNVFSAPSAQKFFTAVGDTCLFCESAIQHGGSGSTFALREFATDIDATKPWSLTCHAWGHNDTKHPDDFLQWWVSKFNITDLSDASYKAYGSVYWTSQNDSTDPAKLQLWERWQQMTFKTNGSTSGDEVISLFLWPSWGRATPIHSASIMNFDNLWLTYTPNNGDGTPPGQVIGLAATRDAQAYEMELTWQNPSDSDFAGTVIRVRNDHPPATKTDGELVVDLAGSPGALESFVHFPVAPQKNYYYAAFTYDNRTTGPNPAVTDYANYSAGVTAENLGEPTPTVDADIGLVRALGWDVINRGDTNAVNFNEGETPAWDTTTQTPSGDSKSAKIRTSQDQRLRYREQDLLVADRTAITIFLVWKPGQAMRLSDTNPTLDGGVWRSSACNVIEIRTRTATLKIGADAERSWPWDGNCTEPIPVPDGQVDLGFHDDIDVAGGGLGTQFDTFAIKDTWQRWWFQMDASRNFKIYDLTNVVPAKGPHLLISGQLGAPTGSPNTRITIGDNSTSFHKNTDMLIDEVYVFNNFRDVSEVPWSSPCPADFDGDNDVDQLDWVELEDCASGPEIPYPPGCEEKDLDEDGDIDQEDFGLFQRCYAGEDIPPDPDCMG